jgi:hypothetical protein
MADIPAAPTPSERDPLRVRDWLLSAVVAFVPAVAVAIKAGNMLNGHTVSVIVAMSLAGYAVVLGAVSLVTAKRTLGILPRALVAVGVTAAIAAVAGSLAVLLFLEYADNS